MLNGLFRINVKGANCWPLTFLHKLGGRIILDDLWMSSVQTVVAFLRTNRTDFVELPVAEPNVCVFQRVGDDLRKWDHFKEFVVTRRAT